jgi:hypothetical protein
MKLILKFLGVATLLLLAGNSFSHGVDEGTQSFLTSNSGVAFIPFLYIGAKHMITGYDHILFLVGVIFFLYKTREILIYVSAFTIGHSTTLLLGVLADLSINAYIIDAIIALSIVYKGFDNLGGFKTMFKFQPNTKMVVLVFGLFHGLGLASKLQEFHIPKDGLLANLIGFNLGVEIGQFLALAIVLFLITLWRKHASFNKFAVVTNVILILAGFSLAWFQIAGYLYHY